LKAHGGRVNWLETKFLWRLWRLFRQL
jgi:hypothetical protein